MGFGTIASASLSNCYEGSTGYKLSKLQITVPMHIETCYVYGVFLLNY